MYHALQELAGEVARLRAEADVFMRVLEELDILAQDRRILSEAQHDRITQCTYNYGRSAKENIERASDDMRNFQDVLRHVMYRYDNVNRHINEMGY
jgi:hypothetical protein